MLSNRLKRVDLYLMVGAIVSGVGSLVAAGSGLVDWWWPLFFFAACWGGGMVVTIARED